MDATRYPLSDATLADIERRFTYHAPKGSQPERYEALREAARSFACLVCQTVPPTREQSLALTHLETAVFFANAGRNE